MTIGELLDLHAKRTPGKWRWDPDAAEIDAHEGEHVQSVISALPTNDSAAYIVADEVDAQIACAAVNALGPLLKLLHDVENASDADDDALYQLVQLARETRRTIEQR